MILLGLLAAFFEVGIIQKSDVVYYVFTLLSFNLIPVAELMEGVPWYRALLQSVAPGARQREEGGHEQLRAQHQLRGIPDLVR